ncbi:MAG: hypothetical protein H6626_10895 [Pseudobdellovibrionaceae bacterium]|nr:MAG: hypothetical protein H6626_10895 [Pseudobdellovibrionaceae bacterium]
MNIFIKLNRYFYAILFITLPAGASCKNKLRTYDRNGDYHMEALLELKTLIAAEKQRGKSLVPATDIRTKDVIYLNQNNDKFQIEKVGMELKKADLPNYPLPDGQEIKKIGTEEAKQLTRYTLRQSSHRNSEFMNEEQLSTYEKTLLAAVEQGDCYKIEKGRVLLRFAILRPFVLENDPRTLVSWIWSNPSEPNKQLTDTFLSTALGNQDRESIVASVHLSNASSIALFERLGFSIKWLFLK